MPTYYQNLINRIDRPLLPPQEADERIAELEKENHALRMKVMEQGSSIRSLIAANAELWEVIRKNAVGGCK